MSSLRRFRIEDNGFGDWFALIEVDLSKLTAGLAGQINAFWSNADSRLADANEDPIVAVAKLAGIRFIMLHAIDDLNVYGCNQEFHNAEGWPTESGIRLIDVGHGIPGHDEFEVKVAA